MSTSTNEINEVLTKLKEAGEVISKLPVEIRIPAFTLLEPFILGSVPKPKSSVREAKEAASRDDDSNNIFEEYSHDKPADNIKLIAAHLYSQYGTEPFTLDEIKSIADNVGITIPARSDATLDAAKDNGKSLFTRSGGKGKFKVTVTGEAYLKTTYNVKKGTSKKQASDE